MKKILVFLLIAAMMIGAAGSLQASNKTLRVATEAGFMPYEFVAADTNELAGFDMDLIRAVGEVLEMDVEITNIGWDGLFPGLLNKQFDVIIAGVTITEERAKTVAFSDPYFESVLTLVVQKDNQSITSLADLAGHNAAVQIGTTGDYAAEDVEGIGQVSRFNTVPDAVQAVANRAADAAVLDLPVAQAYLQHNPNAPLKMLGAVADSEYFGIVMRKQDKELKANIDKALAQLQDDGTYDQIFAKWFGSN